MANNNKSNNKNFSGQPRTRKQPGQVSPSVARWVAAALQEYYMQIDQPPANRVIIPLKNMIHVKDDHEEHIHALVVTEVEWVAGTIKRHAVTLKFQFDNRRGIDFDTLQFYP